MSESPAKAKPTSIVGLNPTSPPSKRGDDQQDLWDLLNQKDENKETQLIHRVEHSVPPSRSSPSAISDKKAIEVTPTKSVEPTQPPSIPHEVLSKRKVNGVWDSCHSTDLTIHLTLSTQEDLDEILEEFCRLQRLGHFTSAREFFAENLHEHMQNPQVLMGYAELLLEQGDYNSLSGIDDDTMRRACDSLVDSDDRLLLTVYWKLIKVVSAHYKPDRPHMLSTKYEVIDGAIDEFHAVVTANKRSITSTEVKILALFYRLCGFIDDSAMPRRLQEVFPPEFHEGLYVDLLRDGRIWDLRDIAVACVSSRVGATEYWGNTRKFVRDWSRVTTDTSTTLALLDILVSHIVYELEHATGTDDNIESIMRQSEPLALSIIENDPDNMKSRSFVRWMLAKAQFTDVKGPHYARSYGENLQSCPGLVIHSRRLQLPQYIPAHGENPGWKVDSAAPRFERPVRVARKISRELGDYQTEVIALQRLILLSGNPYKEFEELCNLQNIAQGDVCGYSRTLVSKYLISNTDDLKQDLKLEISRLFDIPNFSDSISMLDSWILHMLQYSLEGEGPAAQRALEGADGDYQDIPWAFRVKIDERFPAIQGRVGPPMSRSPSSKLESRFNKQRQGSQGTRERPEVVYLDTSGNGKHQTTGKHDDLGGQEHGKGVELPKQHPTRQVQSPRSSEEDDCINESYEYYEDEDRMTKTYAPRIKRPISTPNKALRWVDNLQSRKGAPGLAPGESSRQTSRTATSIFDQSQGGSGTATSSNQSTKPNDPTSRNGNRQSTVSDQDEEAKQLNTLDKPGLIEYLQNKRPTLRKRDPTPKFVFKKPGERDPDTEREEHSPATVEEVKNKGPKLQGQDQGTGNTQPHKEEREIGAQDVVVDIGQKGKERIRGNEEPQRLEANLAPSMAQTEPKIDPAVATVESTEDLGENAEGTTSSSTDETID